MLFTFSKEIQPLVPVEGYGVLKQCRLYQVFSEGRKIGQYFGHRSVSFFAYGEMDVRIEHQGFREREPRTRFVNQATGEVIGKYGRWVEGRLRRNSDTFGCVWLGARIYEAFEMPPQQEGRFQVQVGREEEQVAFLFGFDREFGVDYAERPIGQGTGFLSSDNLLLLFGGLCMLEEFSDMAGSSHPRNFDL